MTCPCGHHAACVPGCALMDYPGYTVDILPRSLQQQSIVDHRSQAAQQIAAEAADVLLPYSPSLPDVTRDPAPVASLVQEIDDWYAANDPLMAGAGDGNSPPWTEKTLLDGILEARGERYGKFADNALVAQQIKHALTLGRNVLALDDDQMEALHQIAAKISRIVTGDPNYVDNWDDIAGYAKLVADRLRNDRA